MPMGSKKQAFKRSDPLKIQKNVSPEEIQHNEAKESNAVCKAPLVNLSMV
jgi:hypothetical protein